MEREPLLAKDSSSSSDVAPAQTPGRTVSKKFILLITCLSALCDCLLLSVIGEKPVFCVVIQTLVLLWANVLGKSKGVLSPLGIFLIS